MFELTDLPNLDELKRLAERYGNPDIEGLQLWLTWMSANHSMLSSFEAQLMKTAGISRTQFFVLMLLKRYPEGRSIGQLADGVTVASQTMTRMVNRMVDEGLCTRIPDPADARGRIVQLTDAGHALVDKAVPRNYQWVANTMAHFTEEDRRQLRHLLAKLEEAGFTAAQTRQDTRQN